MVGNLKFNLNSGELAMQVGAENLLAFEEATSVKYEGNENALKKALTPI